MRSGIATASALGAVCRVIMAPKTRQAGRHRLIAGGVALAALLAAACSAWPHCSILELVPDGSPGLVLLCARMQAGEEFVLSFTHSVNRRPVFDTLRAERDHLVIVRSRFDAFGAGMPETSSADGTLTVAEDGWLEWQVNRAVPELTVRVGRVAEHVLQIKGRRIRLADLAQGGAAVTFRVRREHMIDFMKGRCIS
jgi:hypothetical protein